MAHTTHLPNGIAIPLPIHIHCDVIAVRFNAATNPKRPFDLSVTGVCAHELMRSTRIVSSLWDAKFHYPHAKRVIHFIAIFGIAPHIIGADVPFCGNTASWLAYKLGLIRHHGCSIFLIDLGPITRRIMSPITGYVMRLSLPLYAILTGV